MGIFSLPFELSSCRGSLFKAAIFPSRQLQKVTWEDGVLRSKCRLLWSGDLLYRGEEMLPKQRLLHREGGVQLPGRDRLLRAGKLLRARTMYWVRLLRQRGAVLSSNLLILFPDHIYLVRLPKSLQEFSLGTWLGFAHFATVGSTYLPD